MNLTKYEPISLVEAINLVLDEAEKLTIEKSESNLAYADHSKKVLLATQCIQAWYDEYGHHFKNYKY